MIIVKRLENQMFDSKHKGHIQCIHKGRRFHLSLRGLTFVLTYLETGHIKHEYIYRMMSESRIYLPNDVRATIYLPNDVRDNNTITE